MLKLGEYSFKVHHNLKANPQTTVVEMVDAEDKVFGVGVATVGSKDQYNRKLGRKIALTRALTNSKISKESRTEIWHDYFTKAYITSRQEVEV